MPCKIQIKESLENKIRIQAEPYAGAKLDIAQKEAKNINTSYGHDVVSFYEGENDYINKFRIDIPQELIDKYFDNEKQLEIEEARNIQEQDSKRTGEEYSDEYLFQLEGTETQLASPEILSKVKEAAKKMGISIQDLAEYVKNNPGIENKGINGLADTIRKIAAVAQGLEDVALTEEVAHIAVDILEQVHPELVQDMIKEIGKFNVYEVTRKQYEKIYVTKDGKPDVRKIKIEAIGKLISALIVDGNKGEGQYFELSDEAKAEQVKKWWQRILEWFKGAYIKSGINLFKGVAKDVLEGNIQGETKGTGILYQIKDLDDFYNTIMDKNSRMELIPENGEKKRHYLFDSKEVARSVTEKIKSNNSMSERSAQDKVMDDIKKAWGSDGHSFIQNYSEINLIDENGYLHKAPLDRAIDTSLPENVQEIIIGYLKELFYSYPEGTRFLTEKMAINTAEKGGLASTIDFIALVPDGESFYVEILDWKFTTINKERTDDIPWYKKTDWKAQMGEYSKMMYQYGLKPSQLRKARMIPFIMNYEYIVKGDRSTGLTPVSIEVGSPTNLKETQLYLLPVPTTMESTGNKKTDEFLRALNAHYNKLREARMENKNEQLNQMEKAIRKLHVQLNFEPMYGVAKTFMDGAAKALKQYESLDYTSLSIEEISPKLQPLLDYKESALKFTDIDEVYLSTIDLGKATTEEKNLLSKMRLVAGSAKTMMSMIDDFQKAFAIQYARKENVTSESAPESILKSEKMIDNLSKTFLESSKLAPKVIQLAVKAWKKAKAYTDVIKMNKFREFEKLLIPVEEEAKQKGTDVFSLIGEVRNGTLKLIRKVDKKFYDDIKDARKNKNKQFIIDNINVEEYKRLAEEQIQKDTERIRDTTYSIDNNTEIQDREIERIKRKFDITQDDFNGYDDKKVRWFISQTLDLEKHISQEYNNMSENTKALWQFFTDLNLKGRELGYITKEGLSFFPLIEGTIVEKLGKTNNVLKEVGDILQGETTVKINEQATYGQIDRETGEAKKTIRRYFTKTDKELQQLSTDVGRIGTIFIEALYNYENKSKMESVLQTLQDVENNKHNLVVQGGHVVLEAGVPVETKDNNKNAPVMQAIIDSYLYDIMEDANSLGNVGMSNVVNKLSKEDADVDTRTLSVKKIMSNIDTQIRVLGVGGKVVLGITNWMGQQIHSFIYSGGRYTTKEYQRNNVKITSKLGLSTIEKALLDKFVPLNEDVSKEAHRRISRGQSWMKGILHWSFTDAMMATNSYPERLLQFTNGLSFLDNTMVENGKLVNIRQYLRKQDSREKYAKDQEENYIMSQQERRALEKTFEDRVKELQNTRALKVVAKIENDELIIPGITDEEIANYRLHILEFGRKLNGQMTPDDMASYRKDSILRSFMMFKTWIPPMLSERTLDIHQNLITEDWEYGRTRVFMKAWIQACNWNITRMGDIIVGNDKGLKLLDEMLERKRNDYFKKTGQVLEISQEEFNQMIREQLSREVKELGVLLHGMGLIALAAAAKPPEDASDYEKNAYKWWARLTNKIVGELAFYYDPTSFQGATTGSILPSLNMLTKVKKFTIALSKETVGYVFDDEEMMKKAHPGKYFFNIVPGLSQIQNEYLPYVLPEFTKEWGVIVSAKDRRY